MIDDPLGVRAIETRPRPGSALRCALCHDRLEADGVRTCPGCGTATHPECVHAGGCPTLGCVQGQPQVAISAAVRLARGVKPFAEGCAAGLASLALGLAFGGLLTRSSTFALSELALWFIVQYVLSGGVVGHTASAFDAWRARRGSASPPVQRAVLAILGLAGSGLVATLQVALHEVWAGSQIF